MWRRLRKTLCVLEALCAFFQLKINPHMKKRQAAVPGQSKGCSEGEQPPQVGLCCSSTGSSEHGRTWKDRICPVLPLNKPREPGWPCTAVDLQWVRAGHPQTGAVCLYPAPGNVEHGCPRASHVDVQWLLAKLQSCPTWVHLLQSLWEPHSAGDSPDLVHSSSPSRGKSGKRHCRWGRAHACCSRSQLYPFPISLPCVQPGSPPR